MIQNKVFVRNIHFIILLVLTISGIIHSKESVLPVKNLNFEQVVDRQSAHWHWWSRTGEHGSVSSADTESHSGFRSVVIRYSGEEDWALVNRDTFKLEPGSGYQVSAWVKVDTGNIQLRIATRTRDGKTYSDGSETITRTNGKWQEVRTVHEIPHECIQFDIRFVGKGQTQAWVDDVNVGQHHFDDVATKPLVQGFADKRIEEKLDRGIVVRRTDDRHVYIGWRLFKEDPADAGFHVYRQVDDEKPMRLTQSSVSRTTDFVDQNLPDGKKLSYRVQLITAGDAGPLSKAAVIYPDERPQPYIRIPLQGDYQFQKVGIGDLDGDGRYDFVIKQPHTNVDPFQKFWYKSPETYKLEACTADGEFLWRYDLGWNIERGIWYSPYVVYDFNGDGRAEVAVKSSRGDHRDKDGRVTSGPEYLTILDGLTGEVIAQTYWLPRGPFDVTSNPYNYMSRNQIGVAYLDGKTPAIIISRGTSGNSDVMLVAAYELRGESLRTLWQWDNINMRRAYLGQGAHWLHAADVDGDGRQEVTLGALVLDDNGTCLWTLGMGHPDHHYVGDIDPTRPGMEIYYGFQSGQEKNGMCLVDGKTGEILWGHQYPTRHVHSRGMCSDIISDYPGAECYSADSDQSKKAAIGRLRTSKGKVLSKELLWGFGNFTVYWDADPQREIMYGEEIRDYSGHVHEIRVEGKVRAVADILGDWREELVTSVDGELRIYTTTIPATDRHVCLMQDPLYRNDVAMAAMGYFQIPMLSYDLATRSERIQTYESIK